ncbi:MAG TPA: divalent-cation tolerance protein CutA [Steroidobacter sp.]|jgi:periplasmic divalent cation tolerance protein|nr:divalent-cation tolerance protein CutA [Steroidobacter sp.]
MPDSVLIAFSTCPDEPTAARIAQTLVSEGLAACVNRIPGACSTYMWDGRLHEDAEILLIIKTTRRALTKLTHRLRALHPYECPELIATAVIGGNENYLDWVRAALQESVTGKADE